jgi:acyl carrier protein
MNERLAVRELLQELLRRKGDDNDFGDRDSLIASGRLDSVDTIALLVFLEKRYGVDFAERGFDRDELDSVDSILAFLGVTQLPV